MKAIDHEPHAWVLLEEDGALIVDVNCSHSFFGYSFAIQMNPDEVAEYQSNGRSYIGALAQHIQDGAPILKDSRSAYKDRKVAQQYSDRIMAAVREWNAGQAGAIDSNGPG